MNDGATIAALATPPGEGAIALLRVSGPEAVAIAGPLFRGRTAVAAMVPRRQYFGEIAAGGVVLDEVLLTVFQAPSSATGEEVVEIACHGGRLLARRLLEREGEPYEWPGDARDAVGLDRDDQP